MNTVHPIEQRLDRVTDALGVRSEATAVLLVVLGVLVLVFPRLVAWVIGLLLVLVGLVALASMLLARRRFSAGEPLPPPRHAGEPAEP